MERDLLLTGAFARLDVRLRAHGLRLEVADLRGSEQECQQAEFERAVFKNCLDEVDNCKPRMVCLLGDRYGWVPYEEGTQDTEMAYTARALCTRHGLSSKQISGKSITHLEVMYGLEVMDPKKCFFFIRDLQCVEPMSPEDQSRYISSDPMDRQKLASLKRDLLRQYVVEVPAPYTEPGHHVQVYPAVYEGGQLRGLDALNEAVHRNLTFSLYDELNARKPELSDVRVANLFDEALRSTLPMPGLEPALAHLAGKDASALLLTGPAGVGKSVLMAQIFDACERGWTVLGAAAGSFGDGASAAGLLGELARQLARRMGRHPQKGPVDAAAFLPVLIRAAQSQPVLMLLDGLERLDASEQAVLGSVLCGPLPAGVRCVAACAQDCWQGGLNGFHTLSVKPPEDGDALVRAIGLQFGKRLDQQIRGQIAQKMAGSPAYARIAAGYLSGMRFADYTKYSGSKAHLQWMSEALSMMPDDRQGAVCYLLERAKALYGDALLNPVLRALARSHGGVSNDALLEELSGESQAELGRGALFKVLRGMKRYVDKRDALRRQLSDLAFFLRPVLWLDVGNRWWSLRHAGDRAAIESFLNRRTKET